MPRPHLPSEVPHSGTKGGAPWWMYLLAACLIGSFALGLYVLYRGPETPLTLFNFDRGAMVVEEVLPDSAASRAGLQVGDRILAIDGRPTPGLGQWDVIRLNVEAGHSYQLQVERDGQSLELTLALEQRSWKRLPPTVRVETLVDIMVGLATLLLGVFVGFSRPRDPRAQLGALILGLLAVALVSPATGHSAVSRQLPTLLGVLVWWPSVAGFLFPLLFFSFCALFPRPLFRARWAWALALGPNLLFLWPIAGFFHVTFINPHPAGAGPSEIVPRIGGSILTAYVAAGLLALVLNYRRLDVNERRRVRVLVGGTVVSLVGLLPPALLHGALKASASGPAGFFYSEEYALFTGVLFLALPFSWAYAILRHRVFALGVLIRQGLQYGLARGLLFALVPALAAVLVLDLLLHGDQPLVTILQARGWVYAVLGGLALVAHTQRGKWLTALDRRFFRERYDAQRLLREVVEEVRGARSFEKSAPRVAAQIEAALHPEFAALLVREPKEADYRTLAAAPAGQAPPPLPVASKLVALLRLLNKPLEVPQTESGWLQQQLPHEETDFLRRARLDLLVPIAVAPERTEALLALGPKRSEEPYSGEDQDLLVAVATSLAMLLEKPAVTPARVSDAFEECPRCGACYDTGAGNCAQEGVSLTAVPLPRLLAERYRLQRRLGRGGMGTVYAATDTALERPVAVKVIRDELVGNADAAERFRREARAAASFTHPNVVTVHDFGLVADTRAFLVMELLRGAALRDELQAQKRLTPARTLEILRGVCAAVEAAHRRQLIHRDLKPENIFLARAESGEVPKILDFGIAKFLPTATASTADTGSGLLVGTLHYMAPEQLRGESVAPAWDLWALAVVAYEMLTGARPFPGAGTAEWQGALLTGRFTPLAQYLPDAPARWQEFFTRALAPEQARRSDSARRFFSELEAALA